MPPSHWQDASIPTTAGPWASSWPALASAVEREELLGYLESRFGIPRNCFSGLRLLRNGKSYFMVTETPHLNASAVFKVQQVGIKAFRRVGAFFKPTTRFVQIFGRHARLCRVKVSLGQLKALREGEIVQMQLGIDTGYVILELDRSRVLGLGFYKQGGIYSQIRRSELRPEMLIHDTQGRERSTAC